LKLTGREEVGGASAEKKGKGALKTRPRPPLCRRTEVRGSSEEVAEKLKRSSYTIIGDFELHMVIL
jgi:hypothetical protein